LDSHEIAQPLPMSLGQTSPKHCCGNCALKLTAESSASGMRCGKAYYDLAPAERKPKALTHYPETLSTNTCDSWAEQLPNFWDSQRK
jgi:hypothetical protein